MHTGVLQLSDALWTHPSWDLFLTAVQMESHTMMMCCRHSCKRKLAELSEATDVPSNKLQAAPQAQQPFEPPSCRMHGSVTPSEPQEPSTTCGQQHSNAMHDTAQPAPGQAASRRAQQDLTAPRLKFKQGRDTTGTENSMQGTQHAPPESSQQAAARSLRHCTSLHSMAENLDLSQDAQHGSAEEGCRAAQTVDCGGQRAQHEANSLSAQNVEACVASTRRLEQPTASTGTSRPVPLVHAGQCLTLPPVLWLLVRHIVLRWWGCSLHHCRSSSSCNLHKETLWWSARKVMYVLGLLALQQPIITGLAKNGFDAQHWQCLTNFGFNITADCQAATR